MKRRYLSLIPFEDALEKMRKTAPSPRKVETVLLDSAVGRVLSEAVYAKFSVPGINVASMDGLAVHSSDTRNAADRSPVVLSDAVRINTGQPLPLSYDAVIMIEDVWEEDGKWLIRKSAAPWQFVRPAGEDIRKGDLILPRRHLIRAIDIGGLASYGIAFVNVLSVKVGIISTGGELVPLGMTPSPEQGVESNNFFAEAYLSRMGATCKRYPLVPDDREKIAAQLLLAVRENDLVLLSAGSSAGSTDYSAEILKDSGKLIFHGVGIKPGKPVMMGIVEKTPVLGMPGYPVAAHTVVREFAARLLEYWGMAPHPTYTVKARLGQNLSSDLGYDEFVPVSTGKVDGRYVVIPLSRGFGVQSALLKSNGYIHIPSSAEGLEAKQEIDVTLYENPSFMERSLLMVGSSDTPLQILADCMVDRSITLRCCPTSNLGGILALRAGICHAAPVHIPILKDHTIPDQLKAQKGLSIRRLVIAEQPFGLATRNAVRLEDLKNLQIMNSQRGTANRLLLDAVLARDGIPVSALKGYENELKNPDMIASNISSMIADAGICTQRSAANAGLRFLPLGIDAYELVMRADTLEDPRVKEMIEMIQSDEFKERLVQNGGFDTGSTGKFRI